MADKREFYTKEWLLQTLLPVVVIPLIISYGSVQGMYTQQNTNNKRIEQNVSELHIQRVEVSQVLSRISKLETIIENLDKTLDRQADTSDRFLIELKKMNKEIGEVKEVVAVLKDRDTRE